MKIRALIVFMITLFLLIGIPSVFARYTGNEYRYGGEYGWGGSLAEYHYASQPTNTRYSFRDGSAAYVTSYSSWGGSDSRYYDNGYNSYRNNRYESFADSTIRLNNQGYNDYRWNNRRNSYRSYNTFDSDRYDGGAYTRKYNSYNGGSYVYNGGSQRYVS